MQKQCNGSELEIKFKCKGKLDIYLCCWVCSIYKKIPPAIETLRDSNIPAIGILTSSQDCIVCMERPFPSLPNTKHRGILDNESANSRDSTEGPFDPTLLQFPGWPANIFIWNLLLKEFRWDQSPDTRGSWKEAPLAARRAFSLKGSQQPASRKIPSCSATRC